MTFDEYWNAIDSQPVHIPGTALPPPPPGITPTRTDLLRSYADQMRGFFPRRVPLPPNRPLPSATAPTAAVYDPTAPGIAQNLAKFGSTLGKFLGSRPTTNPSFQPMPGAILPSFAPIPGERPALQMSPDGEAQPGDVNDQMPLPESYPPPPFIDQIPELPPIYDTRISGGMLAQGDSGMWRGPAALPQFDPVYQIINDLTPSRRPVTPEQMNQNYRSQQMLNELERQRVMGEFQVS